MKVCQFDAVLIHNAVHMRNIRVNLRRYIGYSYTKDHGELTDNSSSRYSAKQTTYNYTWPDSMYKIFRIVEVPFVYDYTRTAHQLTRLMFQNIDHPLSR